jgi:hypothetical protein
MDSCLLHETHVVVPFFLFLSCATLGMFRHAQVVIPRSTEKGDMDMRHRAARSLWAILVALTLTLACSLGVPAPDEEPTPAPPSPTLSPTDTPLSQPTPEQVATPLPDSALQPSLNLDKTEYLPEEEIRVAFTAPDNLPMDAWVGIVPSSIPHGDEVQNDEYDLSYEYLQGKTSGALTFEAPSDPGDYDFRMHDTDTEGKELASISFSVTAPPETSGAQDSQDEQIVYDTPFPIPDDVAEYMDFSGDGLAINFQTQMTIDEAVQFYQQELSAMGFTDRPLLTVVEEGVFSMVYDGWEDGRAIVVQGTKFGEMTNINIRLEDVP